jgi:small conductance mechanosensitive channel
MILAAVDTNVVAARATIRTITSNRDLIIEMAQRYGPNILSALFILVAGVLVGRWLGNFTMRGLMKREMDPPVRMLLVRFVRLLVLILTLLLIADNLEIKLLPLIAGLGVAGVGVGLAMQGVLSNLVAGLTIIFVKKFRVGEYIALNDVQGQVENIELFSTTLVHPDRSHVIIPNRKIVGEIIHNYGKVRQAALTIGVAYSTDLTRAIEVIRQVLADNPRVLKDPAPVVGVANFGDSAIEIAVKPWTALPDFNAARVEINKAIVERFREIGISIPFPQREIRLLPGSQLQQSAA